MIFTDSNNNCFDLSGSRLNPATDFEPNCKNIIELKDKEVLNHGSTEIIWTQRQQYSLFQQKKDL